MSPTLALTDQDRLTLRTAAWGAVSLMSAAGAAGSAHKAAAAGSVALTSATGPVGHVLAKAPKGVKYGRTVAELADQVLPALNASMGLLKEVAPAEADNFRRTVLVAVEAATEGRPSPTMTEMARKISAALAASTATGRDRPELDRAMQAFVEAGVATGMQLRVNDERGEWVGTAGVRELGSPDKPPADGRFRVGSSTKTFVATVVLQLVAEGRIGLDGPVNGYLPEFGLDERITVRMLLQHTSGIFNHTGEYYEDGTFAPGIAWSGKEWVEGRFHTHQPEELVRLALSKPARFEPGADWSYANTNYVLARLVIERVTGRSFAQELQRLIAGPLGLTGTEAPGTSTEITGPHAHSYYRYEDGGQEHTVDVTRQNPSWISAGGDMISTTQDLHTFFAALNGGRLLPAELLAEMRKPDPKIGYGLGIFEQDLGERGGTVYHHNGGMAGSAALMYSTPDGGRTMTASVTYVDDAGLSKAAAFQQAAQRLVDAVFGDGRITN
ncbi:serine hydrolase domain-containing protein [Nonomuraea sp. NPDC049646]|uniref:serine hydrolase domain-containing protein n=1 Tax=unclassified Nonomuraea TaxID=2593643 RepID=UPI003790FB7E